MNRRDFSKLVGGGFTLSTFSGLANNNSQPANNTFTLKYAPHFGMFKNHAGDNLIDQLHFMHEMGFRALEDNEMMERPIEMQTKIGETLAKLDMKMGVFVVKFDGFFDKSHMTTGKKEWTNKFLAACHQAVETSKRVNAKWMTVVPGNFSRELPMGIQTGNVIENLKRAAEIFEPHQVSMVLEPLSDNPDLFLRHSDQIGRASCRERVSSPV